MKAQTPRGGLICLILLGVVWAVENWLVQGQTLSIDIGGTESELALRELKRGGTRMILNLLIAGFLVLALRGRLLYGLFALNTLSAFAVLAFHDYFHEPLTWSIFSNQIGEGSDVTASGVEILMRGSTLWLLLAFGLKVSLVEIATRRRPFPVVTPRLAWGVLGVYLLFVFLLASYLRPLNKIRTWHSFSYLALLYGYTHTWVAEMIYIDADFLRTKAKEAAQKKSDLFHDVPLAVERPGAIAIVQAESLDFNALQVRVNGDPLMPSLVQIVESGAVARIKPIHLTGSSDADFTFLMTAEPNGVVAPYKVPGFGYDDSVIHLARAQGFRCFGFHGNRGTFFSRRSAFRQMAFDQLIFEEDVALPAEHVSLWGIPDDYMLGLAAEKLSSTDGPVLTLTITLTTHYPFRYLPASEFDLYPQAKGVRERFLNNMRYLDRALADYWVALPDGTLVFIYGDHASHVEYDLTGGESETGDSHVPFIVLVKGQAIPEVQAGFDQAASRAPGHLDAATYFRRHLQSGLGE